MNYITHQLHNDDDDAIVVLEDTRRLHYKDA